MSSIKLNLVKGILAAIILTLVIAALPACTGFADKTYNNPDEAIKVNVDDEFVIKLDSSPLTGYMWNENYDANTLELVSHKYRQPDNTSEVGMNGVEVFCFQALKPGDRDITFAYKSAGKSDIAKEETYVVNVD